MSILKSNKTKSRIIDLTKPVEIKTYLTVSVLGKSLNLNVNYKRIDVPELDMGEKEVNIYLPSRYKVTGSVNIVSEAIKKMYDKIASIELESSMEKIRIILGFAPDDYEIKRMSDSFCKVKNKVITINPDIVKYDRKVIDSTLIQAFCKARYKQNSKAYKEALKNGLNKYENYKYRAIKVS